MADKYIGTFNEVLHAMKEGGRARFLGYGDAPPWGEDDYLHNPNWPRYDGYYRLHTEDEEFGQLSHAVFPQHYENEWRHGQWEIW